jgi:hypothetical protein
MFRIGLRRRWWGALTALWLLSLGIQAAPAVRAAGPVTFTINVTSAYLRNDPSSTGTPTFSTFQGQTYVVVGRTADSTWLALDAAGATGGTWIRASFGTVTGDLAAVPVTGATGGVPTPVAIATARTTGGGTNAPGGAVSATLTFTVTVKSTYVRAAPDYGSTRLASLFKGEVTTALNRDAAGNWVRVRYGGSSLGWLPLGVGKLGGDVLSLPVEGSSGVTVVDVPVAPAAATPTEPFPAWVPAITANMSSIYRQAAANGRDPNMFALVGDCNSEEWLFLGVIAVGNWDYVRHPYLAPTVRQFSNAFVRNSVAVSGGFNTVAALDWGLANPTQCRSQESPFACELRVTNASLVFIELGTGDHFTYEQFEGNYRRLIHYALSIGVLPILRTKADRLETEEAGAPENYINDVIRRLGAEYDVPVLDFDLATRSMPNHGLLDEPGHDFHVSAQAIGEHVESSLQTLYAITHAP